MFSGMLAGFLKVAAVAVVTGGFVGGIYWAVQVGGSEGSSAFGQAETTLTVTITPEDTPAPLTPTPTALPPQPPAPTATPPATAEQTKWPSLPPPPPKPESPTVVEGGEWDNLLGGQWLRFLGCIDFYLPAGRNFSVQFIALDPGGSIIAFTETSSDAFISFWHDSLMERGRADQSGELGAAFDQIASTISTIC